MHRTAFIWQQIDAKLPDNPEGHELRAKVRAAYTGRPTSDVIYVPLTPVDLRILQELGLA